MCVCVCVCCVLCHVCVQVSEMLYWAKEQNEEKSPMLTQFTMHFNNVSQWYIHTSYVHTSTYCTIIVVCSVMTGFVSVCVQDKD